MFFLPFCFTVRRPSPRRMENLTFICLRREYNISTRASACVRHFEIEHYVPLHFNLYAFELRGLLRFRIAMLCMARNRIHEGNYQSRAASL